MHIDPKEGRSTMDYAEHMKTYNMFCKGALYLTLSAAAIMVLLAIFVV